MKNEFPYFTAPSNVATPSGNCQKCQWGGLAWITGVASSEFDLFLTHSLFSSLFLSTRKATRWSARSVALPERRLFTSPHSRAMKLRQAVLLSKSRSRAWDRSLSIRYKFFFSESLLYFLGKNLATLAKKVSSCSPDFRKLSTSRVADPSRR